MQCERVESYVDDIAVMRRKKSFSTLDEAILFAKRVNCNDDSIHKVVAYKCKVCFQYHIGRNGSILKEKERKKYKLTV